jgi:hypothetical protein
VIVLGCPDCAPSIPCERHINDNIADHVRELLFGYCGICYHPLDRCSHCDVGAACACQHDGRGTLVNECEEHQKIRDERDALLRLAKHATNGWACYASRKIEHDEIARLHRDIAAVEGVMRAQLTACDQRFQAEHQQRKDIQAAYNAQTLALTEAQQARDKAESLLKQAHRDLTDPIGVVAQWQNEAETNRQAWLKERTRAEAAEATLASLRQLKPKHVCSSCDLDDEERAERKGWNAALKAVAALAGAGPTPPPRGADSMNHAVCSECTGHSGQHAQGCTKASPRNELTRDYLRGYATALIDAIAAIEYARDKGGPDDAARDGLTAAVFVIRHMRPPGPTPPQEPT